MISDFDKMHVAFVMREGNWFSADLLRLIEHADAVNREKIRSAFPEHVAAYEDFLAGRNQEPWPASLEEMLETK